MIRYEYRFDWLGLRDAHESQSISNYMYPISESPFQLPIFWKLPVLSRENEGLSLKPHPSDFFLSEPESRRRLIYLQQSNTVRDATCNTFGSDSLHKKIEIGSKTGVIVASSSMGLNIFDLFNEIINVDDMKLGCPLDLGIPFHCSQAHQNEPL